MRLAIVPAASALVMLASAGAAQAACSYDVSTGLNKQGAGIVYPGAEGREWFMKKSPISVGGKTYEAYGLPREFGPMDFGMLERAGVYSGVMAFREKGGEAEVVYVPVSAKACTFQPYQQAAK